MSGKGKQFIPEGKRVQMAFPGGGGFGQALDRDKKSIIRDLTLGYISKKSAKAHYNLSNAEIDSVFKKNKS